ncbi:MAG: hypothetical protein IT291_08925 [Deltaproteobacteria bacterium]|nr:hypothetical protein [Deltaproteobacteria bacterium]
MKKLPPLEPAAIEDLRRKLEFLDDLIKIGEEPYEIENEVNSCAHMASVWFFGWLVNKGFDQPSQVLADLARDFVTFVYIYDDVPRPRSRSLATISKNRLAEFVAFVEFAVTDEEWKNKHNPFDGLILFYEFLDEVVGYVGADAPRRKRALEAIRRSSNKRPCSTPQPGYELTQ